MTIHLKEGETQTKIEAITEEKLGGMGAQEEQVHKNIEDDVEQKVGVVREQI